MPKDNKKDIKIDIEVFKTGKHIDGNGTEREWTDEDLDTIANTYNEKLSTDNSIIAPAVAGHPKDNDPALGWVEKLYKVGDKLKAIIKLVPTFAEQIENEAYKKVSISLYENLLLRHVGFLGAVPPAVKGLEPVTLNHSEKTTTFEFADLNQEPSSENTIEQLKQTQKEREIKFGIGVKDKIGYLEKPAGYKDIEDDSFADPVNYLYPINDFHNLISSRIAFSPWDNGYSNIERQIIETRFLKAEEGFGIDLKKKFENYRFSENSNFIELNEKLKRDKPAIYQDYSEEDFGDPTHFRFPLKTKSDVRASIAIFKSPSAVVNYSETDKQVIASRLLRAATNYKINLDPKTWVYNEIPIAVEDLSKKQLENYILSKTTLNHKQGNSMNEYLQKLMEELIAFLNESATPEIATQTQAWIDDYKTKNPVPTSETPQTSDNNEPQIPKEFAERMANLEKENRYMKFKEYTTSKIKEGYLLPANESIVLDALEMAFNKGVTNFSENGKSTEISAESLIKKLVDLIPKQIEFGEAHSNKNENPSMEFNEPGFTVNDLQSLDLHTRTVNFMEEQKKLNINIDYKTALSTVSQGVK